MNPIAVIAADLHLDELTWRDRPQIRGDAYWGFEQCCKLARRHKCPLVLLGDVVEALSTTPNTQTISFIRKQLDGLAAEDIEVFTIAGNHDMDTPGWMYAAGAATDNWDLQTVELGGLKCFFMGYRPGHILATAIEMIPGDTDVVFAHQHWREFGGGSNSQGKIEDLRAGKLLISGDLHEFRSIKVDRKDGQTIRAVSPGATCLRKVNEPTTHYALLLNDDMSITKVKLRSRPVLRTTIKSEHDLETFCIVLPSAIEKVEATVQGKLPAILQTPLLIIQDMSWLPGVEARLDNMIGDRAHLLYYRAARGTTENVEAIAATTQATAVDLLPSMLRAEVVNSPDVLELLETALLSESPKRAIAQYRNQMIAS